MCMGEREMGVILTKEQEKEYKRKRQSLGPGCHFNKSFMSMDDIMHDDVVFPKSRLKKHIVDPREEFPGDMVDEKKAGSLFIIKKQQHFNNSIKDLFGKHFTIVLDTSGESTDTHIRGIEMHITFESKSKKLIYLQNRINQERNKFVSVTSIGQLPYPTIIEDFQNGKVLSASVADRDPYSLSQEIELYSKLTGKSHKWFYQVAFTMDDWLLEFISQVGSNFSSKLSKFAANNIIWPGFHVIVRGRVREILLGMGLNSSKHYRVDDKGEILFEKEIEDASKFPLQIENSKTYGQLYLGMSFPIIENATIGSKITSHYCVILDLAGESTEEKIIGVQFHITFFGKDKKLRFLQKRISARRSKFLSIEDMGKMEMPTIINDQSGFERFVLNDQVYLGILEKVVFMDPKNSAGNIHKWYAYLIFKMYEWVPQYIKQFGNTMSSKCNCQTFARYLTEQFSYNNIRFPQGASVVSDNSLTSAVMNNKEIERDGKILVVREMEALAEMFGATVTYDTSLLPLIESDDINTATPFLYVELESDEICRKIASRSVLIKGFYKVWCDCKTYDEALGQIAALHDLEYLVGYHQGKHWKLDFESFGKRMSREEQLKRMHRLKPSQLWSKGSVSMVPVPGTEHITWALFEEYGLNGNEREEPLRMFLATTVAKGSRDAIARFNLQERKYLGTTSMDPELSIISINMGHVRENTLMLDPFVGTGSFVLVASAFGAQTFGCDIDIHAMQKQKECNIDTNFQQLGLSDKFMGPILCDNSSPPWRSIPIFESIVCDPPYGIRAGAKKIGPDKNRRVKRPPEGFRWSFIPEHCEYKVPDVMADLLELAAKNLVMNGRLVYWLPTTPEFKESDLPKHPCLALVSNCLQVLSLKWGRRLITMKKVLDFDPIAHNKDNLTKFDLGQIEPAHEDLRERYYAPAEETMPNNKPDSEKTKKQLTKELKRKATVEWRRQNGLAIHDSQLDYKQTKRKEKKANAKLKKEKKLKEEQEEEEKKKQQIEIVQKKEEEIKKE
ncbi:tRNA guanosine-2'-O-methyltransferase 11 [Cavenderia fasciculata]|uniref:tRNA (guanine(10)-N(2))-methyltransferase n=1 Tax=Cavenderia fasciculata TaxID=261658 RepID=F4Q4W7_CACFS|nr:tRNA guanosine-2'-O-methyltransferase 11 [Cavenderia fasciculata]EGG17073.1 tRNA guanosine-2'-O-methyltransferase 11 [Cavenderia fasciculata]|eukprot:XP_004355557.1 tRNA guanosine-2'-O-methyltransferase 11 [Cavenderia fasciculata]